MAPRRKFRRTANIRCYRKLFLIATEGAKTEPTYFRLLDSQYATIHISCIKGGHASAPQQVLARMEKQLKKEDLRKGDEAWLVVDKDEWSDEQLAELFAWSETKVEFGLALSNPKFEYWLLLHFEDGTGISSSRQCSQRLALHLPGYDKGFDPRKMTFEMIQAAIDRAEQRDRPRCEDWPRHTGTTVYRLVQHILDAGKGSVKTENS